MGWGNYLVTASKPNLLDEYLADFLGDSVIAVDRVPKVAERHLAVIGVHWASVELVCDGCGRQPCLG